MIRRQMWAWLELEDVNPYVEAAGGVATLGGGDKDAGDRVRHDKTRKGCPK